MQKQFRVELEKEQLIFSAAHFITFADVDGNVICEQLHGHNYRVCCEVVGPLNEHGYVVDFIALRNTLAKLVGQLDHQMLIATQHPTIAVSVDDREKDHWGPEKDHWGQANVFIISCTHSISSTTPDQESTAIFPIQLIRVQSMPYRTWPVPRARSPSSRRPSMDRRGLTAYTDFLKHDAQNINAAIRYNSLEHPSRVPPRWSPEYLPNVDIAAGKKARFSPCRINQRGLTLLILF